MSEPQKQSGSPSLFSSTVKGEKAMNFEEAMAGDAEQGVEVAAEVEAEVAEEQVDAAEVVNAEAESAEGETDAARLVREATEALRQQAQAQAAPQPTPDIARAEGQIQALKEQIAQMGQAQEVSEPEGGFDLSILESPEVHAQLQAARDSDDPTAEARALAVIAQHVYQAERGQDVDALKKELDGLREASQQQQRIQQNHQMFQAGLEAARGLGEVEAALIDDFRGKQEFERWNAHIQANGPTLEGYQPQSLLGAYLMVHPEFAATPTLMQAGVTLFARDLVGSKVAGGGAAGSTTGAGVRAKASAAGGELNSTDRDATVEEQILGGILEANKRRKSKAKAFSR